MPSRGTTKRRAATYGDVWRGDKCTHPSSPDHILPEWERVSHWLYHGPGVKPKPPSPKARQLTGDECEDYFTMEELSEFTGFPISVIVSLFYDWNVRPAGVDPDRQARYDGALIKQLQGL